MFERSYHFIPADRVDFFNNIGKLPADAVVFDLEDAVAMERKSMAIEFLQSWLASNKLSVPVFVRVNGANSPLYEREINLLASTPDLGLILPKAGTARDTESAIRGYLGENDRAIIILIEDLSALTHIREIAAIAGIVGIGIGFEDLLSTTHLARQDLVTLVARIRTEIAIHCESRGIQAIDSISLDLMGGEILVAEALEARSAGMKAMFSIHPRQLAQINRIFSPTSEQIKDAVDLINIGSKHVGCGYICVNGKIISPPKIKKARAILEFASHHEQLP